MSEGRGQQAADQGSALARGFQFLLIRVALLPFVVSLGILMWLAYVNEFWPLPGHLARGIPLVAVALPLSWGVSLWWGWSRARRITRALEDLVEGPIREIPAEFSGIADPILTLHAHARAKQDSEAAYRESLQRVQFHRQLLERLSQEGLGDVELQDWSSSLLEALESTRLAARSLSLWVRDGPTFLKVVGAGQGEQRRQFGGTAACWRETDGQGQHFFFLKVEPVSESLAEVPGLVPLVVEIHLDAEEGEMESIRDRLSSLTPLLAVSWANWTLYQELFSRIQVSLTVLDSLEDGVLLVDRQGEVLRASRAAGRILGETQSQLQGVPLDSLIPLPEGASWENVICRHLAPPVFEIQRQRQAAPPVELWVFSSLNERKLATSKGLALSVVLRDITRQRELENLRSDFTATLSHELRTPLTSMKGYLQTLMHRKARDFDMDKIQGIVRVINGQADQLQKLIQELLEAARMRSDHLEIRPRPVELRELAHECLTEYENHKIQHEFNFPESCWVMCDPDRIRSVLEQLLSNAHKYSLPNGKVELGCKIEAEWACCWVRDEGVGIPPEQQEKIFEMYHRLDISNQRTHYGLGVGLFIARRVVESHGGKITVSSTAGLGSTFTFTLPLYSPEQEGSAE